MKKYKNDIWLIACLLLFCLISFVLVFPRHSDGTDELRIYGDGILLCTVPADHDTCILVYREEDGYAFRQFDTVAEAVYGAGFVSDYNLISVEQGKAAVVEADCSGQDCVRQKEISKNGESVICLPHKILLCFAGKQEKDEDAVTW